MTKTKELSKDVRGQDCTYTQGWNGLQDHRQAAWREGDNSLCDYSQIEETQNNCQSPSSGSQCKIAPRGVSMIMRTVRNPKSSSLGINSTRHVWRRRNAAYDPKNTIPTVKHESGNIMLCGCFFCYGDRTTALYQWNDGRDYVPSGH